MKQYYVYIAIAGEDKILICTLDSENGTVTVNKEVEVPGGPEILAVDPAGKYMFVGCHPRYYSDEVPQIDAKIYSYRIDGESGDLLPNNQISQRVAPVFLAVDKTGKYLLSAYYKAGKAAVHRIGEQGEIQEATQWFDSGGGAHSFNVDPSNRFAFLPHVTTSRANKNTWPPLLSDNHILPSASNTILQFKFDDNEGHLIPNEPFRLPGERGGGPRHFCFHPRLNVVYFSNEQGCTVTAYRIDTSNGTLSSFQIISTLPEGYDEYTNVSSLRITHSGKFLYVLNRGHDSIACYTVDLITGRLKLNQLAPTEIRPRELGLDPEDKFLFVVGFDKGRMASYSLLDDGTLTQLESRHIGRRPTWVMVTGQEK